MQRPALRAWRTPFPWVNVPLTRPPFWLLLSCNAPLPPPSRGGRTGECYRNLKTEPGLEPKDAADALDCFVDPRQVDRADGGLDSRPLAFRDGIQETTEVSSKLYG